MRKILELSGNEKDKWVLVREKEAALNEVGKPDTECAATIYRVLHNPYEFVCPTTGEVIWYSSEVYSSAYLNDVMELITDIIAQTIHESMIIKKKK